MCGLAREGVLETSVIIPALGDIFLHHYRLRILPHRKLALQIPRKRNDLGNCAVQLFRNTVPLFHPRQQFHQLGVFVDRHFVITGNPQNLFSQFFVTLAVRVGAWRPSYLNALWQGSNRTEGGSIIYSDTEAKVIETQICCPSSVQNYTVLVHCLQFCGISLTCDSCPSSVT